MCLHEFPPFLATLLLMKLPGETRKLCTAVTSNPKRFKMTDILMPFPANVSFQQNCLMLSFAVWTLTNKVNRWIKRNRVNHAISPLLCVHFNKTNASCHTVTCRLALRSVCDHGYLDENPQPYRDFILANLPTGQYAWHFNRDFNCCFEQHSLIDPAPFQGTPSWRNTTYWFAQAPLPQHSFQFLPIRQEATLL